MKQTAVEWLIKELNLEGYDYTIEQAKQMEKQQTEISDEEIEKHRVFLRKAGVLDIDIENWTKGAKWYREQLKKKQ